ncbi:MAG: tRNA-dihydrouridine synthase family protein [Myxococcota bacterium]
MRVRDIDIDPALVLAPMEGVTDLTFRRLVRSIGRCGLTVTEFVPGVALAEGHRSALRTVRFDADEHPVSVQVYGRDPDVLAEAARQVEEMGADIVDLNMGCPSKKVCAHSGGSALMKEPELARRIVRAIRAAVRIPFTVKMRAGWDDTLRNAPDLAAMCVDEGAEMIAVHWRTRADKYGGVRRLDTIAEVVRRVPVPVLANGDVVDVPSALETLDRTGAAGLMIGRGAIRDPWVFARIDRALRGLPPLQVDAAERERVLLEYFATIRTNFDSDRGALGRMKKIANHFCPGVGEGGDVLRSAVLHADTPDEAELRVRSFFAARREARLAG